MQQMIMLNSRPQDAYRKQGVLTASPVELVILLYDGLKKNLILGKRSIEKKDTQNAHKALMKAQVIVTELMNSLDMSYEISENLLSIYDFILWSLREANIHKDAQKIEPLLEIVESLREAWREVGEMSKGKLHMREGQA